MSGIWDDAPSDDNDLPEKAKPIASFLNGINNWAGKQVWNDEEIKSVSEKLVSNPIGELEHILRIVTKPINNRHPSFKLYFKEPEFPLLRNKTQFSFDLRGINEVDTLVFRRKTLPRLDSSTTNLTRDVATIFHRNDKSIKNFLVGQTFYEGNYTQKNEINYVIIKGTGIFKDVSEMKIIFDKDNNNSRSIILC